MLGPGKFVREKLDKTALKIYKPSFQNKEDRVCIWVCKYTCACVCVSTWAQLDVECDYKGLPMALEIDCRRDLGTGYILKKLYGYWILNFL